ncbi:type I-E CRISPR-associated protein Cse2/CasB [Salinifilum ghardaiensis]
MAEQSHEERQQQFVDDLQRMAANLASQENHRVREARQRLAELRRGVGRPYPAPAAYDLVMQHDPPHWQEHAWLLTAGLFALHPSTGSDGGSLGTSLGWLSRPDSTEQSPAPSVEARLRQLVTVGPDRLPHHLRQAVQLLRAHAIELDYLRLLRDLCVLASQEATAHQHDVRLRWTREYYRTVHASNGKSSTKGRNT